ncbi:MAG: HEAT repeat domain-containing protein [Vulcanimicrobiota bacterium]
MGDALTLLWRQFLGHQKLYIRLRALRVADASALLAAPSFDRDGERYPFAWALSSRVCAEQLQGRRDDLALRARFLARRTPSQWRYRMSRSACSEAVMLSQHPLQTMACSLRLLGMHGAGAIQPLLEIIRTPPGILEWDDRAECAAWALARLGRLAVPEILQEYRDGSARVRRHLGMALWYLGAEAGAKAAEALAGDASETSTAALLAMESGGSLAMIRARRGPVWLDAESVQALAQLAFSQTDRRYAAAALGCFGPAFERTLPLLRQLACDSDPEVRLEVAEGLSWGGRPDALPVLHLLCGDEVDRVAEAARAALAEYGRSPADLRLGLESFTRCDWVLGRRRAARQLIHAGVPARLDDLILKLLFDSDFEIVNGLLTALARRNPLPRLYLPALIVLLNEEGPHIATAAVLAARWADDPELNPVWRRLLWHPDQEVARLAAACIGSSGLPLTQWGLRQMDVQRLPTGVLSRLLETIRAELLTSRYLLPLLKRPEKAARLAGALALQDCPGKGVVRALRRGVRDPSDMVAVACARSLLKRGYEQYRWVWLRSTRPEIRQETADWLLQHGRPRSLGAEYTSGRCYNLETLRLLPPKRKPQLIVQALLSVDSPEASHLMELGPAAMDWMPQLLGDRRPAIQTVAIEAMERLLPLKEVQAWLVCHGHLLPLDLAEDATGAEQQRLDRLHRLLLQHCQDLGGSPIWLSVSRSEYWDTATRGLQLLVLGLDRNPSLTVGLLAGLGHFEPIVRRFALRLVTDYLPRELWRSREGSQEARLLETDYLFRQATVEPRRLHKAVETLARLGWQGNDLLVPTRQSELLALLAGAGSSELFDRIFPVLLAAYSGPIDRRVSSALRQMVVRHPQYAALVKKLLSKQRRAKMPPDIRPGSRDQGVRG